MLKITMLLPCTYNSGIPIPVEDTAVILRELRQVAGGYTECGEVLGRYAMDDGTVAIDRSLQVFAIVPDDKLESLRYVASKACRLFQQECLYFEFHSVNVEFIRG